MKSEGKEGMKKEYWKGARSGKTVDSVTCVFFNLDFFKYSFILEVKIFVIAALLVCRTLPPPPLYSYPP